MGLCKNLTEHTKKNYGKQETMDVFETNQRVNFGKFFLGEFFNKDKNATVESQL